MKRFVTRRKVSIFKKGIIFIVIFVTAFVFSVKFMFSLFIKNLNQNRANEMLAFSTNNIIGNISILDIVSFKLNSPYDLLGKSFSNLKPVKPVIKEQTEGVHSEYKEPLVYIYNTHQTEEYSAGALQNYNIVPTVFMASNILCRVLKDYGIMAITEQRKLQSELSKRGLSYNSAYTLTYEYLEEIHKKYPSIKYFIDLHRDSVSSRVTINDYSYAKMMFVIGMHHDNYKDNESLMLSLNEKLSNSYDGIMRSVFYGKNSRYNQHFNKGVILIEIGGPDNSISEVNNSVHAFGEALASYIGENNG